MKSPYPAALWEREFVGYGLTPPNPEWPGKANIAVSFVINYTVGSELNVLNGDAGPEWHQTEIPAKSIPAPNGKRADTWETMFEFGPKEGVPRLLRLFKKHGIQATWNINTQALEMSQYWTKALLSSGHELSCGSKRFIDYSQVEPEVEEKHVAEAIESLQQMTGDKTLPHGWLIDRYSPVSSLIYAREHEARGLPLLYSSDSSADDLPFWVPSPVALFDGKPDTGLLMVPVTHDTSDFRFTSIGSGWSSPNDFYEHLVDCFDTLWEEGEEGSPKMMTVILHPHIIGRAGRCAALDKFLSYIGSREKVWIARRDAIAQHWATKFPYDPTTAFGQTKQVPC